MKQTYIFCLLFISLFSNAQIINFPDANFKAKLLAASSYQIIASSQTLDLNGNVSSYNSIDTNGDSEIQISEALQIKYLKISNSNISNLSGIEFFTNLENLQCSNNQISSMNISNLINLKYLYCSSNQLTNLNVLSSTNLKEFSCFSNGLTNLNVTGLTNLKNLYCSVNQLTNLNFSGCTNLQNLICSQNQLTNLDFSGLTNLKELNCTYNQLSSLDVSNLTVLNQLTCDNNYLLTHLFIKNNNVNWMTLSFTTNWNLKYICADDEDINIVQQKIDAYNYSNCHVNSYCSFTPGGTIYEITGSSKFDFNNNGCDVSDINFNNLQYNITNGSNSGALINNTSGNYYIPVLTGNHTITPVLENPSYFNISPTSFSVNFPTQTSPYNQNFCITPNGVKHDVEVYIIPTNAARPGFDARYRIIYRNKGNQIENGTINFQFNDAVLDLVSSNPTFTTQTTNNISFNYSNLNPFETRQISVVLNVNSPIETPPVNAGDFLIYIAEITQSGTDELPIDNTFGLKQIVVNSLDPNDKTCLQGNTISPDKVGDYVHYVIRFENTGTFPAENIVVKDMIDTAKFDVSSLIPLNASHNYVTRITGNKVEFIFENINLPFDDATNDGYITFKIKTLPTLVNGNTFSNSANIYFDYNFPIITNTATTTIAALNNPSFEFANYFSLYPNPTTNELNINLKSAIEINSIEIYNTIGQLITVQTGNALKLDVSNLKTGNYFIKINTNEGFSTSQFIKK